jgi:hypothetical protein
LTKCLIGGIKIKIRLAIKLKVNLKVVNDPRYVNNFNLSGYNSPQLAAVRENDYPRYPAACGGVVHSTRLDLK